MFHFFEGTTADKVWLQVAAFFRNDLPTPQNSRAGRTREILRAALSIRNPRQRWVGSRSPAINPAFALAEVIWIMSGRNDAEFVNHYNPRLPQFSGRVDTYHGAYGHRLRAHLGIDQLARACEALTGNAESRQVVLQIWDARADCPDPQGRPAAADIPCNVLAMLKLRDGRLEWTQIARSNDLMLGVPHNIVQFTCIQEILAGWIGVDVGSFNVLCDSLHVYEADLDHVRGAAPMPLPTWEESIALPREESEHAVAVIASVVDGMRRDTTDSGTIDAWLRSACLPRPFENILRVLAADSERRRGRFGHSAEIMAACSNPVYVELWQRWERRWKSGALLPGSIRD